MFRGGHDVKVVITSIGVVLIGFLVALPGRAAGAPSASPPPIALDPWIEVRSARFRVITNATEPEAQRVARHLERLAETLERTTSGFKVDGGKETRVFLFHDQRSFRLHSPFKDDAYSSVAGLHVPGEDVEQIAYFLSRRDETMEFASHEYIHVVLMRTFGPLPIWVNEGLAEFFSNFLPHERGATIGRPIQWHVARLRQGMMPLDELLGLSGESPEYSGGERTGLIYAQSWALVHALVFDPAGSDRLGVLLRRLAAGVPSGNAIRDVYGPSAPDSLLRQLRVDVEAVAMHALEVSFSQDLEDVPLTTRSLPRVEVLELLGELALQTSSAARDSALRSGLESRASGYLAAAWESDSSRMMTAALNGRRFEERGDRAGADAWFGRVERADGADARASAIAGTSLARRRLTSNESLRWRSDGPTPDALRARALLTRALAARPDVPEWLVPLALTYLEDTLDVSRGMGALIEAGEAFPHHPDIPGAMALLSLRMGNLGAALYNLGRIPWSPNERFWRENVGWLVLERIRGQVVEMANAGRPAGAESLIARARATAPNASILAGYDRLTEELHRWGERSTATAAPPTRADRSPAAQAPTLRAASVNENDPIARASQAIIAGDYDEAERLLGGIHTARAAVGLRAQVDSLAAEARNRRRMRSAGEFARQGAWAEACIVWHLILDDHPSAAARAEIGRLVAQHCAGGVR